MKKIPDFRFMDELKSRINAALDAAAAGNHELAALHADHIVNTAQRMALAMGKDTILQFTKGK